MQRYWVVAWADVGLRELGSDLNTRGVDIILSNVFLMMVAGLLVLAALLAPSRAATDERTPSASPLAHQSMHQQTSILFEFKV